MGFFFFLLEWQNSLVKTFSFFKFSNTDRNLFNKQCMILGKAINYTSSLLGTIWKLSRKHITIAPAQLVLPLLPFQLRKKHSQYIFWHWLVQQCIDTWYKTTYFNSNSNTTGIAHNCLILNYIPTTTKHMTQLPSSSLGLKWPISCISLDRLLDLYWICWTVSKDNNI